MFLTLQKLRDIATGCDRVIERDGRFCFLRFTDEQYAAYYENADLRMKCGATAGITLSFDTNATELSFTANIFRGSSRGFWYFDITINGGLEHHLGMDSIPSEGVRLTAALGEGRKRIAVYFPNLVRAELSDIELNGDVEPVKYKRKLLFIGDSITQGYDAVYPSAAYPARVAKMLGASFVNLGIGAARFTPGVAAPTSETPDIVVSAFGSNDWVVRKPFGEIAAEYYDRICQSYPKSRRFAVTPIWVSEYEKVKPNGTWDELYHSAEELCRDRGITVIDGRCLTPHSMAFFTDGLHPNDLGFAYYAEAMAPLLLR